MSISGLDAPRELDRRARLEGIGSRDDEQPGVLHARVLEHAGPGGVAVHDRNALFEETGRAVEVGLDDDVGQAPGAERGRDTPSDAAVSDEHRVRAQVRREHELLGPRGRRAASSGGTRSTRSPGTSAG